MIRLDKRNVGDIIYKELQDENVDVSLVSRQDDCENFTSMIFIHPDGDHDFIVGPGKNYSLRRTDVDFHIFCDTRAVSAASLLHWESWILMELKRYLEMPRRQERILLRMRIST